MCFLAIYSSTVFEINGLVCSECIRDSVFNPMSIFGITLVLLSICTNVTGHTAMVTNLSRPGAIRIMPQMYVLKVFI